MKFAQHHSGSRGKVIPLPKRNDCGRRPQREDAPEIRLLTWVVRRFRDLQSSVVPFSSVRAPPGGSDISLRSSRRGGPDASTCACCRCDCKSGVAPGNLSFGATGEADIF